MQDARPDAVPPTSPSGEKGVSRLHDNLYAMRVLLVLDAAVRLVVWAGALIGACLIFTALGLWPKSNPIGAGFGPACWWACCLCLWTILFNVCYVVELVALRLLIPTPREGRYPVVPGQLVSRQVIWACLVGVLVKARFDPPFPGFLVFQIANLPPMCWLMGRVFGPRSRSCNLTDALILDPDRTVIGRNVVIGLNTTILAHHQDRDAIVLSHTIIEDNVIIGGDSVIFGGSHLKAGCMIGSNAVVLPGTVVGPNEFWAGVPARKIRDLPPLSSV